MKITLVVSTRNNLKYLKWSYDSIRKNQGNHEVHICYGIDHCTDGTQEWVDEIKKTDPFVRSIENTTGKRLGHTIMYDRIINEIVETDLAMIFHSDMYLCLGALDSVEHQMYRMVHTIDVGGVPPEDFWKIQEDFNKSLDKLKMKEQIEALGVPFTSKRSFPVKNTIISLTRIEPPLHPSGPEKVVLDFGTEPENFDETKLLLNLSLNTIHNHKGTNENTNGVFAPWAFWVDEFKAIGGHDPLFAPQSKEDSDIFNRFKLNGCEFIQTWKGFVYHLTCRGSRFNPNLTEIGKNSSEWEGQNIRSSRNFIRKWGHFVKHDEYLNPIIPHKYKVGFHVTNCRYELLELLEPWCDNIFIDLHRLEIARYIETEQPNTAFDLEDRVDYGMLSNTIFEFKPEIEVFIDGNNFNQKDFEYIQQLSEILTDSGEIGEFKLGNLNIKITALNHYEHELIVCKK